MITAWVVCLEAAMMCPYLKSVLCYRISLHKDSITNLQPLSLEHVSQNGVSPFSQILIL